jgi:hypothetical protein
MLKTGLGLVVLSLAAILSGCCCLGRVTDNKQPVVMTPELEAALIVAGCRDASPHRDPQVVRGIESKLHEVGAKMAADGKMYDRNGKEIYLCTGSLDSGVWRSDADAKRMGELFKRDMDEARRKYTVIEVGWYGPRPS